MLSATQWREGGAYVERSRHSDTRGKDIALRVERGGQKEVVQQSGH